MMHLSDILQSSHGITSSLPTPPGARSRCYYQLVDEETDSGKLSDLCKVTQQSKGRFEAGVCPFGF